MVRSMQEWMTVFIRRLIVNGIMEKELGMEGYMNGGQYIAGNGISGSEGAVPGYLMPTLGAGESGGRRIRGRLRREDCLIWNI